MDRPKASKSLRPDLDPHIACGTQNSIRESLYNFLVQLFVIVANLINKYYIPVHLFKLFLYCLFGEFCIFLSRVPFH